SRDFGYTDHSSIASPRCVHFPGVGPGTVGDSYDNALAETVNGLYKAELIHAQGPWTSVGEVELATLQWVHWWNTKRLHEALDYATPQEVETEYYLTQPINTGP
ncbi:integrase core domain-containing protein, partial [Corynebacterium accolens]|uniref:integrase core domain-containing protein n=1 Tax=Corynebacterium accolens TaxID=38284 RepID=UPI002542E45C